MVNVTMRREWGQWHEGSFQIANEPETHWRDKTSSRTVVAMVHAALRHYGINPNDATWHHVVTQPESKLDEQS